MSSASKLQQILCLCLPLMYLLTSSVLKLTLSKYIHSQHLCPTHEPGSRPASLELWQHCRFESKEVSGGTAGQSGFDGTDHQCFRSWYSQ